MIDNEIFKRAVEKLTNALNHLDDEEYLANKALDRKIRYSYQMIELEDIIKKLNLKIEKISKNSFKLANELFSDVFVGDNFKKDAGGNVYAKLENGTNVLINFLNDLTLTEYINFFREVIPGFELKTVEDLENFINLIPEERFEPQVTKAVSDLKMVEENVTMLCKESYKDLNRLKRALSVADKLKIKNMGYIKKLKNQKEICETNYENYILTLNELGEISARLNYATTAFKNLKNFTKSADFASYKNAVKSRDSYLNYKETLISSVKEDSTELSRAKQAKSKEKIKQIVEKCISKEEIEDLKKDAKFLIQLGTMKKSKTTNKAEKLLASYLVKAIAPQQQEISK